MEMILFRTSLDTAAGHNRLCIAQIRTGHIKRYRIKRGQHSHIRDNRHIIFRMAVTEGRNIADQADVKTRFITQNRCGIFHHLFVQDLIYFITGGGNGIFRTSADAAPAADTAIVRDRSLSVFNGNRAVRAIFLTHSAANTKLLVLIGLPCAVHLHFTRSGAAAHANVFEGSSKARSFMALKMCQRNKVIGIHDSPADLCFLHIIAVFNGDECLIRSLKAVRNDDVAVSGKRIIPVRVSGIKVIQRVFASSNIKSIAVSQNTFPTFSLTMSTITLA